MVGIVVQRDTLKPKGVILQDGIVISMLYRPNPQLATSKKHGALIELLCLDLLYSLERIRIIQKTIAVSAVNLKVRNLWFSCSTSKIKKKNIIDDYFISFYFLRFISILSKQQGCS